ncbi:MAG: cupin domain-containing protein [Clostridiaceae bacterium]|nr:cupin domain-containing protein [Clostridiaceae bacterium]
MGQKMIEKTLITSSGQLMMVKVNLPQGFLGDVDQHVEEQLTYVEKGKVEFQLNDDIHTLSEGESLYMPSNVPHRVKVLEACILLDIFTPIRQDVLKALKK